MLLRRRWVLLLGCTAALAGCARVTIIDESEPAGAAGASPGSELEAQAGWPMVGRDASHQGRVLATAKPAGPSREWDVALGETVSNSPVIGDAGVVYVATATALRALGRDGSEQWSVPIDLPETEAPSPAIGRDGNVYVRDGAELSAYLPDGSLAWRKDFGSPPIGSITVGSDGSLFVPTGQGTLLKVSPSGSLEDTTVVADSSTLSTPAFDPSGRMFFSTVDVFVGSAFAEGNPPFEVATKGIYGYQAFPVAADDGTFFIAEDSGLFAVSSTGTEKWRFQGPSWNFGPAVGADGTAYFAASDRVSAIRADGTTAWEYALGAGPCLSTAITIDGSIWAACPSLLALAPDGSLLESIDFGSRVTSPIAIDEDGTVIVGTEDGWLHAR